MAAASLASRVLDFESGDHLCPLPNLNSVVLVTLQEAIGAARADEELSSVWEGTDATLAVQCAVRSARNHKATGKPGGENLTVDEMACIHIYTQESPLYRVVNARLREPNRTKVGPFKPFIKLFLTSLYKLPTVAGPLTLYRGLKGNVSVGYAKGTEKTWWAFSSTTAYLDVMQSEDFLGSSGERTMFHIHSVHAYDIKAFSANPKEEEFLLPPYTVLEVKGSYHALDGLSIVQLLQQPYTYLLSGFPIATPPPGTPPTVPPTVPPAAVSGSAVPAAAVPLVSVPHSGAAPPLPPGNSPGLTYADGAASTGTPLPASMSSPVPASVPPASIPPIVSAPAPPFSTPGSGVTVAPPTPSPSATGAAGGTAAVTATAASPPPPSPAFAFGAAGAASALVADAASTGGGAAQVIPAKVTGAEAVGTASAVTVAAEAAVVPDQPGGSSESAASSSPSAVASGADPSSVSLSVTTDDGGAASARTGPPTSSPTASLTPTDSFEIVVAAMRAHPKSVHVQKQGCKVLKDRTFKSSSNQRLAAEAGGIEAIIAALSAHEFEEDIHSDGCAALKNIGWYSRNIQQRMCDMDVPEIVRRSQDLYPFNSWLQNTCEQLLERLGETDELQAEEERCAHQ